MNGGRKTIMRILRSALVLGIVAAVIVVTVVLLQNPGVTERSGAEQTPSATPSPTIANIDISPGPTVSATNGDGDNHGDSQDSQYDCKVRLSKPEYAAFIDRLWQFEGIYFMPPSAERTKLMKGFATKDFLEAQKDAHSVDTHGKAIKLLQSSTIGCYTEQKDVIIAYMVPMVDIVDNTTHETVTHDLALVTSYTEWTRVKGAWLVNRVSN